MKRLAFIILIAALPANAQMNTGMDHAVSSSSFTGPGDVISGATAWWGLRAYSKSYASSLGKMANICTPTDAACADVNSDASGNFNLAGTPSLTCNNSGSICTVKTLYDQSGTSACSGPCDVTQATIANRPLLVVPGAANGCSTTSHYCMSSTGGGAQQLTASSSIGSAVPTPFTVSVVFNNPTRTGDEYLFDTTGLTPAMVSGFSGANEFGIFNNGTTPITSVTDGTYHAIQGVFPNVVANGDINVDGTVNTVNLGAGGNNSLQFNIILLNNNATGSFGGFTEEFGVWPQTFTATNSSNMSSNQHSYWGF